MELLKFTTTKNGIWVHFKNVLYKFPYNTLTYELHNDVGFQFYRTGDRYPLFRFEYGETGDIDVNGVDSWANALEVCEALDKVLHMTPKHKLFYVDSVEFAALTEEQLADEENMYILNLFAIPPIP